MIVPTHTLAPEWQNENTLRAYPLEDDAPAAAMLPTWLVADIRVTCPPEYAKVYISSAYLSDTLVSVAVSGATAGGGTPVALLARTVTRDELEPFRAYSMDRLSAEASGSVAFGEIPAGADPFRFAFSKDEARIVESALVRAAVPGVTRLVDPRYGAFASGVIDISGNSEFRTSVDPHDPQTIVFTLSDMYRDMTTSVCDDTPSLDNCGATPVKTLNGVAPDAAGTITLRFR